MSGIFERTTTWKKGIKITDLKKGDIIYISKIISGFQITFECNFISFEKGIVKAEVIRCDPEWFRARKGEIITTRKKQCYLWGKDTDDKWEVCKWFK